MAKAKNSVDSSKSKDSKSTTKSKDAGKGAESKFHKLFVDELKDIYWAEKNLVKALPKMMKAATTEQLKECIQTHTAETQNQITRLEQVFELIGEKAVAKKCEAMAGLIEEGNSIIEDTDEDTMVRDAGIIIGSQKIEHYEIASYGSLVALARIMGFDEAAALLEETLLEEKNADNLLNEIATNYINEEASAE